MKTCKPTHILMKRIIISLIVVLTTALSGHATKLQTTHCCIYRCQPPSEGFVTTGSAITSKSSSDVLNLDFSSKKMGWKDSKGSSTVGMYNISTNGDTTTFNTVYNYVQATKDGSVWYVDIIYRNGNEWYMIKYTCKEKRIV